MAGADEYQRCHVTPYVEEVDRHFSPFSEHPAVQLAKKYYNNNVGYDAVAVYGAHLDVDGNGNVVFDDILIRDFDSRWSESMQFEFLEVATFQVDFVAKSVCRTLRQDLLSSGMFISKSCAG